MQAVVYRQCKSAEENDALEDYELPQPALAERDLLVRVEAVSVNPVDAKIRRNLAPAQGEAKVLGWDAAGVVEAVGEQVSLFAPGDRVWYAGALDRPGCNSQLHAVDERIVAKMPESLSFKEAAAMPLTSITAWELLFERFKCERHSRGTLLVIGGAGGVGSMTIQLAKKLTKLRVIATASRAESEQWVRKLGADFVIDHRRNLAGQLREIGHSQVTYILSLTHTDQHLPAMAESIAPQGAVGVIDDPQQLDILPFKRKSVSFHWEFMFTRSLFQTPDMICQHDLLQKLAELVEAGEIVSTIRDDFGEINAHNLLRAHQRIESGTAVGKIVLGGFGKSASA